LAEETQNTKLFGMATSAFSGLTKSAAGLGGALLTGQQNLSAYSGAISNNTELLGKHGKMLGQLVDGLSQFAEASLAEYQQLTQIGATFGKEIKDLKVSAAEMGMTVGDMTKFLQQNATSLRAFGGTTDLAIARFKAVSTTILDSAELGTELRRLGMTTNDINNGLALYGELADANSRKDRMSVEQQARAAKDLMVELDGLSKLTGIQKEQLADEMKARRRQGDVNAFLMGKSSEEQAAFTSQLTELQAKLGKDAADAFVDIALRGAPTTESTRGAVLAMGDGADQLYAAAEQFNKGDVKNFQTSMRNAAGAAADYQSTEQFRQTAILGGLSSTSNAFADASAAAFDYKNAIDSVKDGTQSSINAEGELRTQIAAEQARQMKQTTGIFDKTIAIQENLRKVSTTVMEETIPRLEAAGIKALDTIQAALPSAGELADHLGGAVNNLFNAAAGMDSDSAKRDSQLNGTMESMASQMAEDIGFNTTEAKSTGDDIVQSNIDGAEGTQKVTTEVVAKAEEQLTQQNTALQEATQRVEDMVDAGFTRLDPQLQAAKQAAEEAAARVEATQRAVESLRHMQRTGSIRGFAEGGRIGAGEVGIAGEAGAEFISGPATVMSANSSLGVMQGLMKGITNLDASVQNQTKNEQNTISNSSVATELESMVSGKFDQMISQLAQLVSIESSSVITQQKSLRATKGLQGNLMKGVV